MITVTRGFSLVLSDENMNGLKMDFTADEFVWSFSTSKPIIIDKNVDEYLYENIKWLMNNDYEFGTNLCFKDNDQLIWFSDQYCNLEDPNETKRINRLVIKREKDSFVITCVNPFMKENGIKNETAFVMFSPAGNGLYSRNKKSGLTLQDDVVMMWRKTLESNFIAEKKTF